MLNLILPPSHWPGNASSTINFYVYDGVVPLGTCSIQYVEWTNRACGHYSLRETFWGRGYGNLLLDAIEVKIAELGFVWEIAPYLSWKSWRLWMKRDPSVLVDHPVPKEGESTYSSIVAHRLVGQ